MTKLSPRSPCPESSFSFHCPTIFLSINHIYSGHKPLRMVPDGSSAHLGPSYPHLSSPMVPRSLSLLTVSYQPHLAPRLSISFKACLLQEAHLTSQTAVTMLCPECTTPAGEVRPQSSPVAVLTPSACRDPSPVLDQRHWLAGTSLDPHDCLLTAYNVSAELTFTSINFRRLP